MLSELGRREDALTAIEAAVAIHRRLAETSHEAFLPELARSVINQSLSLSELGRHEDALAVIDEALQFVLPVLERAHDVLPDAGLRLFQDYLRLCEEIRSEPRVETMRRMNAVLFSAGVIADDAQ